MGAAWEIYPPNLGLLRSQGREAIGSGAVMPGARHGLPDSSMSAPSTHSWPLLVTGRMTDDAAKRSAERRQGRGSPERAAREALNTGYSLVTCFS